MPAAQIRRSPRSSGEGRLRASLAASYVLGWRGTRIPITAVAADLSDGRDPGTRKAVARVKGAVRRALVP